MKKSLKQLAIYGIVGFVGLGVDWGVFFILRDLLDFNYILSHVISSTLAIINNFLLNSYFTFKTTDKLIERAMSFGGIAALGLLISSILLPSFVQIINTYFSDYIDISNQKMVQNISKLSMTIVVAFIQFFLNKYLTFKPKKVSSH